MKISFAAKTCLLSLINFVFSRHAKLAWPFPPGVNLHETEFVPAQVTRGTLFPETASIMWTDHKKAHLFRAANSSNLHSAWIKTRAHLKKAIHILYKTPIEYIYILPVRWKINTETTRRFRIISNPNSQDCVNIPPLKPGEELLWGKKDRDDRRKS